MIFDKREYTVHQEEMTGAHMKTLAGIPVSNLLFLEVPGPGEHQQIYNDIVTTCRCGSASIMLTARSGWTPAG
jgi:hypothetical protein